MLLVYGKSGTGKRTCCEFLAAEAGVDLHSVDVLDASTFAVPWRGDAAGASFGASWRPSTASRPAAGERDRRDELLSTHTTREVSAPPLTLPRRPSHRCLVAVDAGRRRNAARPLRVAAAADDDDNDPHGDRCA